MGESLSVFWFTSYLSSILIFIKRNKDANGWRGLTWITETNFNKFWLNFSRCASCDMAPKMCTGVRYFITMYWQL